MTEEEAILQADIIEAKLANGRIRELSIKPVEGDFSTEHLQQVHGYIFQDMPAVWFQPQHQALFEALPPQYLEFDPGHFREEVSAGSVWQKLRYYPEYDGYLSTFYSSMDDATRARLDSTLAEVKPKEWAQLPPDEFGQRLDKLYTELDYIHPFPEGNSRTLREFTRQLSSESGYKLKWSALGMDEKARQTLYGARDLGLAAETLKYQKGISDAQIEACRHARVVQEQLRTHGYQDMGQLLKSPGVLKQASPRMAMSKDLQTKPKGGGFGM